MAENQDYYVKVYGMFEGCVCCCSWSLRLEYRVMSGWAKGGSAWK